MSEGRVRGDRTPGESQLHVVTGASSGIGRAIALALAKPDVRLALLGRNERRLDEVVAEVRESGAAVTAHALDLTDDHAVTAFAAGLAADGAFVRALVHSAGVVALGPVARADIANLDHLYRVNVRAPYLLTQQLLPLLGNGSSVVFINSGAGLGARAEWSQYAASKHALKAIADSLRAELASQGVRVTSVYPGRTASPMQQQVRAYEGAPYQPEAFLQPEDVAAQVQALLELPARATVTDLSIRPT